MLGFWDGTVALLVVCPVALHHLLVIVAMHAMQCN
jgi:hypothetical protein